MDLYVNVVFLQCCVTLLLGWRVHAFVERKCQYCIPFHCLYIIEFSVWDCSQCHRMICMIIPSLLMAVRDTLTILGWFPSPLPGETFPISPVPPLPVLFNSPVTEQLFARSFVKLIPSIQCVNAPYITAVMILTGLSTSERVCFTGIVPNYTTTRLRLWHCPHHCHSVRLNGLGTCINPTWPWPIISAEVRFIF